MAKKIQHECPIEKANLVHGFWMYVIACSVKTCRAIMIGCNEACAAAMLEVHKVHEHTRGRKKKDQK